MAYNPDQVDWVDYNRVMIDWAEQQLAVLRPKYPHWDIWYVRTFKPKGIVWCGRPTGSPIATINADSPESLIAEIREQEAAL